MFEMMALSFFCNASMLQFLLTTNTKVSPLSLSLSLSLTVKFCAKISAKLKVTSSKGLEEVNNLIRTVGIPSKTSSPAKSLENGKWVKLICGASFEDVVDIRNRSPVYTLAGVDSTDCAADVSVVSAVNEGIDAAVGIFSGITTWRRLYQGLSRASPSGTKERPFLWLGTVKFSNKYLGSRWAVKD